MAHDDLMERAFSPHVVFRHVTWGVVPGWFEDAPLALTEASFTCSDSRLQHGFANNPMAGCSTSWFSV
jgi:hypothetical protein